MYRGTTPTITINCDIDASEFVTMWVTFRVQKRSTYGQPQEVEITKRLEDEGVDVDGQVISITLTQADTLLLGSLDPETDQTVEVQIRGKTADGRAFASNMTDPEERELRFRAQRSALRNCRKLIDNIEFAHENLPGVTDDAFAFWSRLAAGVKNQTAAWYKKDRERAAKLVAKT